MLIFFFPFLKKNNNQNVISSFPRSLFPLDVVGFRSLCVLCYAQIAACRCCANSAGAMWAAFFATDEGKAFKNGVQAPNQTTKTRGKILGIYHL